MQSKCQSLEREGRFDLAQNIKKEIELRIQQDLNERLEDLKAKQENDRNELENSHMNEFQEFNSLWEKRLESHQANANEQIDAMIEKQKNEKSELIKKLENKIPLNPKSSSELLNMIKIKNGLVKLKEYGEAHKVQQRINMLTQQEAED